MDAAGQGGSDLLKAQIPLAVAVGVVKALEIVDIHHDHSDGDFHADGDGEKLFQFLGKAAAV